jgi:hypothetical protein
VTGIDAFTLAPLPPAECGPQSKVLFAGRALYLRIDGCVLEAQFQCVPGYLLLVTEDCPYEEGLHVYLLGPAFTVLDRIELSRPYSPGILKILDATAAGQIAFSFFGDERWRLTVYDHPRRRMFRKRWLKLHRPE